MEMKPIKDMIEITHEEIAGLEKQLGEYLKLVNDDKLIKESYETIKKASWALIDKKYFLLEKLGELLSAYRLL